MPGRIHYCIAALFILFHAWMLLGAAAPSGKVFPPLAPMVKGPTFDEYFYISAGVSYWKTGDFSENREHPPLAKLITAAPVVAICHPDFPAHWQDLLHYPIEFFHGHNGERQAEILFAARLPVVAIALLLDILLFFVGSGLAGPPGGLLVLALATTEPGSIAAAATANLDFPAAAFCFLALAATRRAFLKLTAASIAIAGIAIGLALLSKLSSLLLAPALIAMAVARAVSLRSVRPLAALAIAGLAAFSVVAAGYGFETRSLQSVKGHPKFTAKSVDETGKPNILERRFIKNSIGGVFGEHRGVPLLTAIKGFDHTLSETGQIGHAGYLLGETTPQVRKADKDTGRELDVYQGWNHFYLVVIPQKLPLITFLMILGGAAAALWRGRSWLDRAFILVFPAVVIFQFSMGNAQLGIKYILPALFPLFVATAWLVPARTWAAFAWIGFVFVSGAQACLRVHPDHAMFYSVLAGGPGTGARVASVGDDWGQDAPGLALFARDLERLGAGASAGASVASFMQQYKKEIVDGTPEDTVRAAATEINKTGMAYRYYGEGEPSRYGFDFDVLGSEPRRGLVAVHITTLLRENPQFRWLMYFDPASTDGEPMPGIYKWVKPGSWIIRHRPFAVIGRAIYVYYIP